MKAYFCECYDSHRDQRKASFNEYCDAHKGDIRFILVITMRLTKVSYGEYYDAHKDEMKGYFREYYTAHMQEMKTAFKSHYMRHKQAILKACAL